VPDVTAVPLAGFETVVRLLRLDLTAKLIVAMLLGGAVGLERQIAGKPAGLRTNILICIGAALFTDIAFQMSPTRGDAMRVISNIIPGIGFIGAGTILRGDDGIVSGLTSAATIWVVAAIGIAVGGGFFLEGVGSTALVMLVLGGLRRVEHHLLRVRRTVELTIRAVPGTSRAVLERALIDEGITVKRVDEYPHANDITFEMRVAGPARQFAVVRSVLQARADVLGVLTD
jgi:putative Mg2+ transporter-C (MgtC) family protein